MYTHIHFFNKILTWLGNSWPLALSITIIMIQWHVVVQTQTISLFRLVVLFSGE